MKSSAMPFLTLVGTMKNAPIGRVFAVARDHQDQHVADHVGKQGDNEHDQPDGRARAPVAIAAAEHAAPEAEARERRRDH